MDLPEHCECDADDKYDCACSRSDSDRPLALLAEDQLLLASHHENEKIVVRKYDINGEKAVPLWEISFVCLPLKVNLYFNQHP